VEGKGLLEALIQALHRRLIQERKFLAHPEERRLRLGVVPENS
jgi:hypothetical protein